MKTIKVSDAVHKQLTKDREEFTKVIGYTFRYNDVINEYHKILRTLEK
jgi:hypothetical protein